jgi:hypothetical protein
LSFRISKMCMKHSQTLTQPTQHNTVTCGILNIFNISA